MRLAILALAVLSSLAALPARADDATRLTLAKALMAQIRVSDTMRAILPIVASQMRSTLAQRGQLDRDGDAFTTMFRDRASAEMDRYTDQMAEAYAHVFDEDELNALLAFDRTPLGQKLIASTPELSQASMLAGRKLGEDVAKEVMADLAAKKQADTEPHKL